MSDTGAHTHPDLTARLTAAEAGLPILAGRVTAAELGLTAIENRVTLLEAETGPPQFTSAEVDAIRALLESPVPPADIRGVGWNDAQLDAIDITVEPWKAAWTHVTTYGGRQTTTTRATKEYIHLTYNDPYQPGTAIPLDDAMTSTSAMLRDDGISAALQALAWVVVDKRSSTSTYLANVKAILTAYSNVTSLASGGAQNTRLSSAWNVCGLVRALWIVRNETFPAKQTLIDNMAQFWLPYLNWSSGPNWLFSMTQARLGISHLKGDQAAIDKARTEFVGWFEGSVFVESLDGTLVKPVPTTSAPAGNSSANWFPWGSLVPANRSAAALRKPVHSGEDLRDYGHVGMGREAALLGGLTARNFGYDTFTIHRTRWIGMLESQAQNMLDYIAGVPSATAIPRGGASWACGWLTALSIFGRTSLPKVAQMVDSGYTADNVTAKRPPTGNSQFGEALVFAAAAT